MSVLLAQMEEGRASLRQVEEARLAEDTKWLAFIESNYLKMSIEDEKVKKADLKLGFNHRSIVKLMERRDYYKNVFLAERICGICNAHHAQTFSSTVESIAGVAVPRRASV